MATTAFTRQRLEDILTDPRESLDVEIKEWLDLSDTDNQAKIAKAVIALANHGGGIVIVGFQQTDRGFVPADNPPPNLGDFSTDAINGIVRYFGEPEFHCDVQTIARQGNGDRHPVITVPGGHAVPIRSKRDSPDGKSLRQPCLSQLDGNRRRHLVDR